MTFWKNKILITRNIDESQVNNELKRSSAINYKTKLINTELKTGSSNNKAVFYSVFQWDIKHIISLKCCK